MIGVDFSPEMLAIASNKTLAGEGIPPIFLCQAMEKLDLYGTVDACVCLLDSINHVTNPEKLYKALQLGPFVFGARGLICALMSTRPSIWRP